MNILVDDAIFAYKKIFAEFGKIIVIAGRSIKNTDLKNIDILIIRSRTKVDSNLLKNSKVKFVGSAVAGLDHIDLEYLNNNNIYFAHAGGCNANAVAEYVISGILNLAKKYNFDYKNKTLGIIGVGNTGKALKQKAENLQIELLLNDPIRQKNENLKNFVSLNKALSADIISFHIPLTFKGEFSSHNLLNADNFSMVKDNAIIFNAARGGVIDENVWLKHQGIKIIDCWQNEPNINKQLLATSELATPHIAGHSIDAKFMGSIMIYQQLCDFLHIKAHPHKLNIVNQNFSKLSFLDAINKIYNFKNDDKILRNGNFEDYRINYPQRSEWHNYNL